MKLFKNILLITLLLAFDQLTKAMAVFNLKNKASIKIIDKVFELVYLENRGAAFGMMQNRVSLFVITTIIILTLIIVYYVKLPKDRTYNPLRFTLLLIMAGALGNFIDRLFLGYVVDFFYFSLIDFPVFNVADCYISIGAVLLIVLMMFYYKDEPANKIKEDIDESK